ncbi:MAG TPA: hypothetical protein VNL91_00160 [Thermoanaerobaculia bacterium]|nr:hypothetical protein [Thermoanaerobaculia bacterium]
MSRFVNQTVADLRGGRESWRVLLALCAPAFAISVLLTVAL